MAPPWPDGCSSPGARRCSVADRGGRRPARVRDHDPEGHAGGDEGGHGEQAAHEASLAHPSRQIVHPIPRLRRCSS